MLDEFIQQYLRSSNIWLTVAHQSIEQIDEQLRTTLCSLGTYLFGRATIPEARILADILFKKDPYRIKRHRKIWGRHDPLEPRLGGYGTFSVRDAYFVLDYEADYLPMDEQQELLATQIAELGLFQFLCRPALHEGSVSQSVIPLTIANLDRDEHGGYQFPNAERVARFRAALAAQTGIPAESIIKELESCLPPERRARTLLPSRQTRQQPTQVRQEKPRQTGNEAPVAAPETRTASVQPPPPITRRVRLS
jgi:hypothetical protein